MRSLLFFFFKDVTYYSFQVCLNIFRWFHIPTHVRWKNILIITKVAIVCVCVCVLFKIPDYKAVHVALILSSGSAKSTLNMLNLWNADIHSK